jgi:hypothetical protein
VELSAIGYRLSRRSNENNEKGLNKLYSTKSRGLLLTRFFTAKRVERGKEVEHKKYEQAK